MKIIKNLTFIILITASVINTTNAQLKLVVPTGHSSNINGFAFTSDGKYVATKESSNSDIKLWDINSGKLLKTYNVEAGSSGLSFSNDDKYLIVVGDKIQKINLLTDKIEKKIKPHTYCGAMTISPDDKYFATGGYWQGKYCSKLNIYYLNSLTLVKSFDFEGHDIEDIHFSHNGKNIFYATGTGHNITGIDFYSGKKIFELKSKKRNYSYGIDISQDDKILAISVDGKIKIYDIPTKNIIDSINDVSSYEDIFFSKDNQDIYFLSSKKQISKYNFITKETKIVYNEMISKFCYDSNTGNLFYTEKNKLWGFDESKNTIKKFGADIGEINETNLSHDNSLIAFISGKNIFSFNLQNSFVKTIHTNNTLSVWQKFTVSNDNKYLVANTSKNKNIFLYDLSNEKIISSKPFPGINSMIFLKDNNSFIVSKTYADSFIVYDLKINELRKIALPGRSPYGLSLTDDGRYLFSHPGKKRSPQIVDLISGKTLGNEIYLYHDGARIEAGCISKDGKYIITGGRDKNIIVTDVVNNKKILAIKNDEWILSIAISPDNKYIVSGDYKNNLKVWSRLNGSLIRTIKGHSGAIDKITITNDGKYIVSSARDNNLKIWDFKTGKNLITINVLNDNDWVCYTPEGHFDGTENGIKELYYVKDMQIIPLESFYEQFYTPNLLSRIMSGGKIEDQKIQINDIKLPPLVKITSPSEQGDLRGFKPVNTGGLKSPSQQIEVTIQATDQGGGIDEIRLFVNGKLVETTQRGFKPVVQNNQTKTQTFTISLSNGKNVIKATAFNNQRTESIADEIIVYYEGVKATSDLYLFVIGIDKYRNPDMNLNYAVADATGFKDAILGNTSTIFGSVNTSFITNENATKEKILAEFETIKAKMKQEDVLIFYYAGHGAMSIEDNPLYYLVLYDVHQLYGNNDLLNNKALSVEEIKNICMELPAQKQLFVLDACQSGGVEKAVMRGNAEQKAIAVLSRATGTYWLTASGTDEYATEFDQLQHGVFTYAILQGLKGEADGGNNDKQITVKELDFYIQDKVPELSEKYKGQPQFPKSYGGGDDFPLIIIK